MGANSKVWPNADLRVLWADDQMEVSRSLSGPLKARGAAIDFVADADAAVAKLSSDSYHCVITDLQMPPGEWGGLRLLEWMHERRSPVPALVISGEGGQQETIQALRLGARDYVEKSKANAELLPRLQAVVDSLWSQVRNVVIETGPAPISTPFGRWSSESSAVLRFERAIRCAEAMLRWHAIVGLSEVARIGERLRGVQPAQLRAISAGTWMQLCQSCAAALPLDSAPGMLLRSLPYSGFRRIVKLRNDVLNHGDGVTEFAAREILADVEGPLTEAYWRLMQCEWPTLVEVEGLKYRDGTYSIVGRRLHGSVRPFSAIEIDASAPAEFGHTVNCWRDGTVTDLTPFAATRTTNVGTDVLLLDGARTNRTVEAATDLSFRTLFTGERAGLGPDFSAATLLRVLA